VFVTDASSGVRGHVDAKGNQNVGVHDPVSGKGATVDAKGNQNVGVHDPSSGKGAAVDGTGALKVGGSVTANVAPAANWFNVSANNPLVPQTGDALIVTQLQLMWTGAVPNSVPVVWAFVGATDCQSLSEEPVAIVLPDEQNSRTVDLRPGLAVPQGSAMCVVLANGTATPSANIIGYRVPSAQVPAIPAAQLKPASAMLSSRKIARLHG
jgi:hypothetical protein